MMIRKYLAIDQPGLISDQYVIDQMPLIDKLSAAPFAH